MKRTLTLRQFLMDNIHFVFGVALCLLAFVVALYAESQNLEIHQLTYSEQPLDITIPIGIPIEMRFPEPVEFGVPSSIQDLLHIENVASTVYLTAAAPFSDSTVLVKLLHSDSPIVLRLSSSTDETGPQTYSIKASQRKETRSNSTVRSPVELTRFAAQQLFAPKRLVPDLRNVVRVGIVREPINLVRHPDVQSNALVSWSSGSLHVTAVKLTNLSQVSIDLNPEDFRGTWRTAGYHHSRLLPLGTDGDTSVVYLVSDKPFHSALSD